MEPEAGDQDAEGMMDEKPRFLFHWLSLPKLRQFQSKGVLHPGWKHFILEAGCMISGISTCQEPMLWNPDEGNLREPCLVLETSRIDAPVRLIQSSEAYHLTKKVKRAVRAGESIAPILEAERRIRSFSYGGWDEYFVEGPIPVAAVIGIGIEESDEGQEKQVSEEIAEIALGLGLPMLDMTGWQVGNPGLDEVDALVEEMMATQVDVAQDVLPRAAAV